MQQLQRYFSHTQIFKNPTFYQLRSLHHKLFAQPKKKKQWTPSGRTNRTPGREAANVAEEAGLEEGVEGAVEDVHHED